MFYYRRNKNALSKKKVGEAEANTAKMTTKIHLGGNQLHMPPLHKSISPLLLTLVDVCCHHLAAFTIFHHDDVFLRCAAPPLTEALLTMTTKTTTLTLFHTQQKKELPHYVFSNLVLNAVLIARKGILITTEQK